MSLDYRLVKCSRCGSTTALELKSCRRCGQKLKASTTGGYLVFGLLGAVLVMVLMGLAIYLTRGTDIGDLLVLIVLALSVLVGTVSNIWLVIAAFQVSGMWGLACIFIPLAQLAFLSSIQTDLLCPLP